MAGEIINCYNHLGKLVVSTKAEQMHTLLHNNSILGIYSEETIRFHPDVLQ